MKNFKFETSLAFDELVKEFGIDSITDLDVGEECKAEGIEFDKLLEWNYENGELDIYVENSNQTQILDIYNGTEKIIVEDENLYYWVSGNQEYGLFYDEDGDLVGVEMMWLDKDVIKYILENTFELDFPSTLEEYMKHLDE